MKVIQKHYVGHFYYGRPGKKERKISFNFYATSDHLAHEYCHDQVRNLAGATGYKLTKTITVEGNT